jgi:hypothetical protein
VMPAASIKEDKGDAPSWRLLAGHSVCHLIVVPLQHYEFCVL